ncbi:MAG: cellulose biosynthesis protein BcsS [Hyphomicrobiaceae bacterium]|nr:MAG: cellulose biosynthesis protein BcsS [Hyphomicrobiaceae bacterium]
MLFNTRFRRAGLALLTAAALGLSAPNASAGEAPSSIVLFSGVDAAPDVIYAYQGIVIALNKDLGRDGFLLKLYSSYVGYEYDTSAVPGGVVDGDGWQGDVMLGYKKGFNHSYAAIFAGVDVQNHRLTPDDPANPVRGTEVGFKIGLDYETLMGLPFYFGANGIYSTAFNTYWARVRAGLPVGHNIIIGPEALALGNDGFDAQRLGGFLRLDT